MSAPIPPSEWEARIPARPAAAAGLAPAHAFPPRPEAVRVTESDVAALAAEVPLDVDGFRPEGVPLSPVPQPVPEELVRRPRWRRPAGQEDDLGEPTTVFPPDTRYQFYDTSFPWSTCGRVVTPAGSASGVMVGPRHMVTASHVVPWLTGGGTDWMTFTPMQFDTSEPFGTTTVTRVYFWLRVLDANAISSNEAAFDYVVCVLNARIGDTVGYMGSRAYSSNWNGLTAWSHVGYPFDIGAGVRPVFHGDGVMDSTISENTSGRNSFRIMHRNDTADGQSGGPYFGWWPGENWPRVVADQSSENWGGAGGPNAAGGGNAFPALINHARAVEP
ncbi:trypsin-like serine peptidase [Streptomyces sp. NPDC004726]